MKGNTLAEFIDDLLAMGGPEKEYEYRGKRYFMQAQPYEEDISQVEFVVFEILSTSCNKTSKEESTVLLISSTM